MIDEEIMTANMIPIAEKSPHSLMADISWVASVIKATNVVNPVSRTVIEICPMACCRPSVFPFLVIRP